jgi:acetyl-CoA carboxylase carboxyltransferase component
LLGVERNGGVVQVVAPMQGTVVSVDVRAGDEVGAGRGLVVLEAMKMEHVVAAPCPGTVEQVTAELGGTVADGEVLVVLAALDGATDAAPEASATVDLDRVRPDLAEVVARHGIGLDAARPDAVRTRREQGRRTARENLADLCDPGSFLEYGPLVVAAQSSRRSREDLIARTPADGLVGGVAGVNGDRFPPAAARCVVVAYDFTVLAGTQGIHNHRKKDRLFRLAAEQRLPVVLFAEGGGGRPGDDWVGAGFEGMTFRLFGALSGLVPMVGVVSGPCFAGNASLLGCCDVVIAADGSNLGMAGPAMIEGGGLGVVAASEIGPVDEQAAYGVVDVRVPDDAAAVRVAKQYLAYFQGSLSAWEAPDPRVLRHAVPENRVQVYDVRAVVDGLADRGSVLELRRDFGVGMVTALARIEGRAVGVLANNNQHLGGAIDSDAADKAARFLQLCDAFDVPIVSLCDTPGFMVGPAAERTAQVRHCNRMFVTGANVSVPFCTVVLRKSYGLGALAMAGGSFTADTFVVSWPTGEFGGMGLEGAVRLGYRRELEAIADPAAREARYEQLLAAMYDMGKAANIATHFEIDDVIDPADTRRWIAQTLLASPPPPRRTVKKHPVDPW